jgi:DNA-binding NarL/FixJ family response regulator
MRVTVVSDDVLFRDAVESLLNNMTGVDVVRQDVPLNPRAMTGYKPETDALIIAEDALAGQGIEALTVLKDRHNIPLVLSGSGKRQAAEIGKLFDAVPSRSSGAHGLQEALAKVAPPPPKVGKGGRVRESIALYRGTRGLTPRELEAAKLVARGLSNRRIAAIMGVREQSIKNLVSLVMRKLGCENRVQVALKLTERALGL